VTKIPNFLINYGGFCGIKLELNVVLNNLLSVNCWTILSDG